MIIKRFHNFLLEGIVDDLRDKYQSVPQSDFDSLVESDPTSQKKYLRKLLQFYVEGYGIDILKDLIVSYHDMVSRNIIQGQDRDIQSFKNFQSFEDVVVLNKYKKTGQEKKRAVSKGESKSSEIVYQNDNVTVRKIYDHEASCAFGKNTKWCITMNSDGHWKTYSNMQLLDFYFVEFIKPPKKNWNKVAVGVNPKNEIKELRDNKDKDIDRDTFFSVTGLSKDLFINTFNKESKSIYELLSKLERVGIERFKVLDLEKNMIEVQQNVEIKMELPFQIVKVVGDCTFNKMTIESVPEVTGTLRVESCDFSKNVSLKASKTIIDRCSGVQNVSLKECQHVNVTSSYSFNDLMPLNLPEEMNYLRVVKCGLTSLKGSPKRVNEDFIVYFNDLKSLEHGPEFVGQIYSAKMNELKNLKGLKGEFNNLDVTMNDLESEELPEEAHVKKLNIK